jgi:hypothetical protein
MNLNIKEISRKLDILLPITFKITFLNKLLQKITCSNCMDIYYAWDITDGLRRYQGGRQEKEKEKRLIKSDEEE